MNPLLLLMGGSALAYFLYNTFMQNQGNALDTAINSQFSFSTPDWLTQDIQSGQGATMPNQMDISQNGLQFIRDQEGLKLTPYKDTAGKWTIGYGHKIVAGDPYYPFGNVKSISADQAEQQFETDVETIAAAYVRGYVGVPLTQNQFDALCSLCYNIGSGNFTTSTLLSKLNSRDYAGAANEFNRWIYSNGIKDPTLIQRRYLESQMFQQGGTANAPAIS